jgi:hypothetical protein
MIPNKVHAPPRPTARAPLNPLAAPTTYRGRAVAISHHLDAPRTEAPAQRRREPLAARPSAQPPDGDSREHSNHEEHEFAHTKN